MSDKVSPEDVIEHLTRLTEDEAIPDVFVEVVDLTAVQDLSIFSSSASVIAKRASELHSRHSASHIIVVAPHSLHYGVARMLEAYVTLRSPTTRWYILKSTDEVPAVLESIASDKENS
ncbi:MAG: hypothetical protein GF313_07875 [Caldithrix sp.]|nr:hypothetical protein [Caldithrix sp.]